MNCCHPATTDLDALAIGALPPGRARGVEAHLDGCAVCREQYEQTATLRAELSSAGRTAEPPEAAVWRLRSRVRMAVAAPATGVFGRWRATAAFAAGVVCVLWFVHRAAPPAASPRPAETSTAAAPPPADPPLTLLVCEQAAARSDAALDQILSRDAARPHAAPGEPPLRAFSPITLAALGRNDQIP